MPTTPERKVARVGLAVQMTGLPSSGKSTIAQHLQQRIQALGFGVELLDGDEYRKNLCSDLGFSRADRVENLRRLAFVAHKLAGAGCVAIIAAVNPYEASRAHLKNLSSRHLTVFVRADIDTVKRRDVKGLYARACLAPEDPLHVPNFTGISDPFEPPADADVVVDTANESLDVCVSRVEQAIFAKLTVFAA